MSELPSTMDTNFCLSNDLGSATLEASNINEHAPGEALTELLCLDEAPRCSTTSRPRGLPGGWANILLLLMNTVSLSGWNVFTM